MSDPSRPLHVAKEAVAAVIRTGDQLVVGELHIPPRKRLKDELNLGNERYLAVTRARVWDAQGTRLLYSAEVVLLAADHVVSVTPLSGVSVEGAAEGAPWLPRG